MSCARIGVLFLALRGQNSAYLHPAPLLSRDTHAAHHYVNGREAAKLACGRR